MIAPARQSHQQRIHRTWAMPNKNTFQIPQIKNLIDRFGWDWVDPFPDPYQRDALEYLKGFEDNSVSYLLFDPPYSPRQLKECYESNGQSLHDTTSAVWRRWKDEIARVMKPNGICISFGWSSNGIGLKRGFEIVEILLVAHGGNHNDTMCVVEQKTSATPTPARQPQQEYYLVSTEELNELALYFREHKYPHIAKAGGAIISAISDRPHTSPPAPEPDHKAPICENCWLDNTTCRIDMAGCLQAGEP